MKFRLVLFVLSFVLSLAIPADRLVNNCSDAWIAASNSQALPAGLGVNIHFTDPQPGEIKMIADAGFRWVRMDFKWDMTEKERGRYDFTSYDRLIAALEQRKIRALFILDYGNPLYDNGAPPRTKPSQQAFARWATAAARHFAGHGVIWEIYNEPNIKIFWPPRPNVDEYVALALAVGRAFRAELPNEKLIGPATSGIDFPFLESCFKAGLLEYWSAVSVHPYRQSDPETAANDYCQLRKLIAAYRTARGERVFADEGIPIISSEWGYSSVWRGMDEQKQSALLAREILTNIADGIPISIWYDWRDDGLDASDPEHHFGLVHNAYHQERDQVYEPKAAYLAAKTVSAFFDEYEFEKRLLVGSSDDYVLIFRKGADVRIAAWTTLLAPHRLTIPLAPGQYAMTSYNGQTVGSITAGQTGLAIEISPAPLYLTRVQHADR